MTYNVFVGTLNLARSINLCHNILRLSWKNRTVCVDMWWSQTLSTSASLSPVSPPDNIFTLSAEVFSSCLAIVSAVMVGGLFLWPALRYGTGYQTVSEIRPSAETPSSVHWRRFYFQLTRVHSALEVCGRCALQIYLLTYLQTYVQEHVRPFCHPQCGRLIFIFGAICLYSCMMMMMMCNDLMCTKSWLEASLA